MSDQHDVSPLPNEAVVLRGGPIHGRDGSNQLWLNAMSEYLQSERWALSVFSWPEWTAEEIAESWRYQGKHMQASTVEKLTEKGFVVVPEPRWEGDTHCLLMLGGEPTEETWERLRPCFGPERPNPRYRAFQK